MKRRSVQLLLFGMVAVAACALLLVQILSVIELNKDVENARKAELKALVDSAHGAIKSQYHLYQLGLLPTEDAAKQSVITLIENMRYDSGGYFYIINAEAIAQAHGGNASTRGIDVSDFKTDSGDFVFQRMAALANTPNAADYFYYDWPRGFEDTPVPKITYARAFAPWGWVVATGIYVDDLNAQLVQNLVQAAAVTLAVILISLAVLGAAARALFNIWEAKHRQLKLSESGYRTLFEQSEDPMFVLVGDRLIQANDAGLDLLGYTEREQVADIRPSQISPQYQPCGRSSADLAGEKIREAYRNGYTRFEWVHLKRDGTEFPVEVTLTRVNYRGESALFVIWRDMTEIYRTLEALEAAKERAELGSKAKSTFMATMTHEIRTPLNAILGITDLLQKDSTDKEELYKGLRAMNSAGKALLSLVNNVLDLSSLESGKLSTASSPFSPHELIHSVINLFEQQADSKGLMLKGSYLGESDDHFTADVDRIRQILINLVGNAVKFTTQGSIELKAVEAVYGEKKGVRFEVLDTGIGIAETHLDAVFETFIQVDGAHNREYQGSGLGLSICKALAEALQGEIWAVSEVGEGSRFSVFIPAERVHQVEQQTDSPDPQPSLPSLRILLVEDNKLNQMVASKMLKNLGHNVTIANDGVEAVEAARTTEFDLVYMDMQMPRMDGLEATRQIRGLVDSPNAGVYICALTANAESEFEQLCYEAGMNEFMTKPITTECIEAQLSRLREHGMALALSQA